MTDIDISPEAVAGAYLAAAEHVAFCEGISCGVENLTPSDARAAMDSRIAEAVAAERERCAKIAVSYMSDNPDGLTHAYDQGWVRACERIAAAIRAGEDTDNG